MPPKGNATKSEAALQHAGTFSGDHGLRTASQIVLDPLGGVKYDHGLETTTLPAPHRRAALLGLVGELTAPFGFPKPIS
jgi:hypothetical protein